MDDQTRKAYWQALSAILGLEEKTSYLRDDEIKAEDAIYTIPMEKDLVDAWEDWAAYIEQKMAAARKLERLKFKLSGAVNA
jgi:hypothetical protein